MTYIIVLVLIILINLFLWFLLFRKLKTTYSPDALLSNIRNEVNKLLIEINREADRDITIIEERTANLQQLIEEADKRISRNNEIINKSNAEKEVISKLNKHNIQMNIEKNDATIGKPYTPLNQYKRNESLNNFVENQNMEEKISSSIKKEEEPIHITFSSDPIVPKVNIKQEIIKMAKEGLSSEVIANKLNVSVREVDLIINISI